MVSRIFMGVIGFVIFESHWVPMVQSAVTNQLLLAGHALNSLDDWHCELFGFESASGEPVAITPLDFDGAESGDDGGAFELLLSVEGDG